MNTEERDGGNGWPEGHFDGANLRFFGSRDGVFAIDVHCYAAAAGRALDIEAIEDLAFNWGYGISRTHNEPFNLALRILAYPRTRHDVMLIGG